MGDGPVIAKTQSLKSEEAGTVSLEDLTLALFTICNGVRALAYMPQIRKAAIDKNGASAISYFSWTLFLIAHLATVAYALVNLSDWGMAACFLGNSLCCAAILVATYSNRRRHARRLAVARASAVLAQEVGR